MTGKNQNAAEKISAAVWEAFRAMNHGTQHIENLSAKDRATEVLQLDVLRTLATPRQQKRIRGMMRERGYHISQSGRPSEQAANAANVAKIRAKLKVAKVANVRDDANGDAKVTKVAKVRKVRKVAKVAKVSPPIAPPIAPELSPDEEISHDSNGGA